MGILFLAITITTVTKYYFLAALFSVFELSRIKVFETFNSMYDQYHHVNNRFKDQKIVFANCEKVQPRNVNTFLIIKRLLNVRKKTTASWRISIEIHYWDVDFYSTKCKISRLAINYKSWISFIYVLGWVYYLNFNCLCVAKEFITILCRNFSWTCKFFNDILKKVWNCGE